MRLLNAWNSFKFPVTIEMVKYISLRKLEERIDLIRTNWKARELAQKSDRRNSVDTDRNDSPLLSSSMANLSPKRSPDLQTLSPFLSTKRLRRDSLASDSFTDGILSHSNTNSRLDDYQAAQDIISDNRNSKQNSSLPPSNINTTISEGSSNEVDEISEEIGEGFIRPITEFKIGISTVADLALNKSPIRSSTENNPDIYLPPKPLISTPLVAETSLNSSESSIEDEGETRWKGKEIVLKKNKSWLETIMN
jgi:hypothetical protein